MTGIFRHLTCPSCGSKGALLNRGTASTCKSCDSTLGTVDGIPDFAPHVPIKAEGGVQRLMNSGLFVSFYESPVWRPFLASLGSGLPAEAEVEGVLDLMGGGLDDDDGLILDLACGTGHYARALSRRHPTSTILGVDLAPNMLLEAQRRARRLDNISYIRGDIHKLPLEPGCAKAVTCGGALHLFPDVRPVLRSISDALAPGGVFGCMTIAYAPGPLRHVQETLVDKGKASFFDVGQLAMDLKAVGLINFEYHLNRVSLLFKAQKGADVQGGPQ